MKRISVILFSLIAIFLHIAAQTVSDNEVFDSLQIRIAVLSDIHVMAPGLIEADGTALQSALQADRKLLDYSVTIFDMLVEKLLDDHPDFLLITGDLTKDGERLSHEHVVAQLERLRLAGVKPFVIPGNHDLGTKHALVFHGDQTTNAETVNAVEFANLYRHFGYDVDSLRDSTSLSYFCEPIKGLCLVGIDSGEKGQLQSSTLDWVCQQVIQARAQGKQVLAMMHHALIPHFVDEDQLVKGSVIEDYQTIRDRLAYAGVQVILTGHIHISDIAKDFTKDLSQSIYDVSTGSPVSYPCDYRFLSLNADYSKLHVDTYRVTSLPCNPSFGTMAYDRLLQFLTTFAKDRVKNNAIASVAANALFIHAEGNEHKNEESRHILSTLRLAKMFLGSALKSKLAARGLSWDQVETIVNSIMTDTTSLGLDGREDQTDDHTLTISLY